MVAGADRTSPAAGSFSTKPTAAAAADVMSISMKGPVALAPVPAKYMVPAGGRSNSSSLSM